MTLSNIALRCPLVEMTYNRIEEPLTHTCRTILSGVPKNDSKDAFGHEQLDYYAKSNSSQRIPNVVVIKCKKIENLVKRDAFVLREAERMVGWFEFDGGSLPFASQVDLALVVQRIGKASEFI